MRTLQKARGKVWARARATSPPPGTQSLPTAAAKARGAPRPGRRAPQLLRRPHTAWRPRTGTAPRVIAAGMLRPQRAQRGQARAKPGPAAGAATGGEPAPWRQSTRRSDDALIGGLRRALGARAARAARAPTAARTAGTSRHPRSRCARGASRPGPPNRRPLLRAPAGDRPALLPARDPRPHRGPESDKSNQGRRVETWFGGNDRTQGTQGKEEFWGIRQNSGRLGRSGKLVENTTQRK